jgi:phosphoenolpyruvate-protein kinase (PTS system EI component)
LDNEQYDKFKAGQTIYINGLTDKQGKPYQGYITLNKETNKTNFSFQNPDKLKEQAKPTEAHKTQTAVNSDGKTNEATKNIKEPLQVETTNAEKIKNSKSNRKNLKHLLNLKAEKCSKL